MFASFPLEIHAWLIPLVFATGWVIGYAHFWKRLRRRHPDLYEEWHRRTHGTEPPPAEDPR